MSYNPLYTGSSAKGSSRQTQTGYTNGTVGTMPTATLVSVNNSSNIILLDVTSESNVENWVGITAQSIVSSASGLVVSDGRIENIPSGLGFSAGEPLWAGLTAGSLTNIKPDLSVLGWQSGYFVLFVGIVVQNEFNNAQLDIQLSRQIIGQL